MTTQMKANELMTDDLVLYGGKPTRVLQLDKDADYKNTITPIPLTVEILKKNDWYQGECGGVTLYFIPYKAFYLANSYKKGYMAIGVLIDDKMLNLFSIKYVHELQHFLRLVGLGDIAENLKI